MQAANEQASSAANMHPLPLEDLVLQALDTALPLDMAGLKLQRGFARDRGKSGRHGRLLNLRRGRHIRSLPGKPSQGRIALMATIHAAIPFQQLRSGRPHLQIEPDKTEPDTGRRIILRAVDIRLKQFRDKAGTLFLFAVDASGSMAINRMRQAKGAVNRLLQQAYIHRDQVALLAFRNHDAQVLLPPSQSVERAKRALDSLPVGGGTPLAAGLRLSLELIEHAQRRGTRQVMLVLLTDGRANVPLQAAAGSENREQIASEIEQLATHIRATGIRSLVIDTQRAYTGGSESRLLANLLAARYLLLPNAAAEEIAKAVQQLVT